MYSQNFQADRIKNLDDDAKKQQIIYKKEHTLTDFETGEVKNTEEIVVKKEKTKEDFLKLFVSNIHYLVSLDSNEKTLFFIILGNMNYQNIISFDKSFRKAIIDSKLMKRTSLYKSFESLKSKKVLLLAKKEMLQGVGMFIPSEEVYIVNPNLVGKGSFRDLKRLRHTIVTDYNFEKLEITQQISKDEQYDGFDYVANNLDKHEIKEISQNKNTLEVVVAEKNSESAPFIDESVKSQSDIPLIAAPVNLGSSSNVELELLKEQNRAKELEIRLKELEVKKIESEARLKAISLANEKE